MIPVSATASTTAAAAATVTPTSSATTAAGSSSAITFRTVSWLMRLAVEIRLIGKIAAAFDGQRRRWLLLSFLGRLDAAFRCHLRALLFQNRFAR